MTEWNYNQLGWLYQNGLTRLGRETRLKESRIDDKHWYEIWWRGHMLAQVGRSEIRFFLPEPVRTRGAVERINLVLNDADAPYSLTQKRDSINLYHHLGYERAFLVYNVQRAELVKKDRAWFHRETVPFVNMAYFGAGTTWA